MQETLVSDMHGVFHRFQLPVGKYALSANHSDFTFPTENPRPIWYQAEEFYRGEAITIHSGQDKLFFMIPMDAQSPQAEQPIVSRIMQVLKFINRKLDLLFIPSLIFATVVVLLYPTILNGIVFAIYFGTLLKRSEQLRKPTVAGTVKDEYGKPVSGVIVRLLAPNGSLRAVSVSDDHGQFTFRGPKEVFQVLVQKTGYLLQQQGLLEVDATAAPAKVTIPMQRTPNAGM